MSPPPKAIMTVGGKKIHPLICVSVLLQNKIKDTRTHIKLAAGQSAETTLRWLMITYRHRVGEHLSHVLGHCNGTCGLYFGGQVPQHGGLRLLICRWAAEESALSSSPSHCQTQTLNRHFVYDFFCCFFCFLHFLNEVYSHLHTLITLKITRLHIRELTCPHR